MPDKIRGNEAFVALVLVNACAAFAVLSAYGPENTRPFIIMVATLMGMGAFYPIYKLLQQPQRYVIRKEKAGDLESYVVRYKGYLWWYDGKDLNGHRLAFKSKEEALEYVRKNVITRLINEKIRQQRQQLKKAKKEYETILDPIADDLDVDTLLSMIDADSPAEQPEQPKNPQNRSDKTQETEQETPKKREPLVIDNKSSLKILEKQIQSTNANQQERDDAEDPDDEKEDENDTETEEDDEKPLGEITHDPVPPNTTDGKKIHPAQELMNTFNEFLPDLKPKRKPQQQNDANEKENGKPSQTQENEEEKETNIHDNEKKGTEETKVLTLSNENPIHRLGPESVTEEMKKILFQSQREKENRNRENENGNKKKATFNTSQQADAQESEESPKTKRKGRKKTYDDTVMKMRQMTIYDMLPGDEKKDQPPTDKTSSGGQKIAKRLEDVKPPEKEKTEDKTVFIEPPKEKEHIEDFQDGSEIKTEEPAEMKPHPTTTNSCLIPKYFPANNELTCIPEGYSVSSTLKFARNSSFMRFGGKNGFTR